MSWLRVKTVVRRLFIVLWRNPARWFDIAVWPVFDVILFGSLGAFVAQENEASQAAVPYMLAGIMLFHVLFQSQVGIATGFMEETWSRNLLNLMTTPLTEVEYAAGLALYSFLKSVLAMTALSLVALGFYGFGLGEIGWALVPVVGVLLLVGYAVALFNIGLMLRFGQAAEIFTWGINFLLLALSGVFNPVEALPADRPAHRPGAADDVRVPGGPRGAQRRGPRRGPPVARLRRRRHRDRGGVLVRRPHAGHVPPARLRRRASANKAACGTPSSCRSSASSPSRGWSLTSPPTAETAGWDGVFVWDHMAYREPVADIADPWVTMAAMACATERVRIGPMVTPLPRRRPWKVAREVATLDRLSGGRVTFGVGLGGDPGRELSALGEELDPVRRAVLLDEGLAICIELWSGAEVHHHGEVFTVDGLRFGPAPVQQPHPPVWVAGRWPNRAPLKRAARFQGYFPVQVDTPEQLGELVADLPPTSPGFDVAVDGPAERDPRPFEAAGATWWLTGFSPFDVTADEARQVAREGPPK